MAYRVDFGTRAAANQARDAFDIDDDLWKWQHRR